MSSQAIAGLRLKRLPQISYYKAGGFEDLKVNEYVVIDTDKCREAARVVIAPPDLQSISINTQMRPILRRATAFDLSQWQQFKLH
ncbi:MAG TPA: hypothetical protein VF480_11530 [Verrucomicrobiae bacterium]